MKARWAAGLDKTNSRNRLVRALRILWAWRQSPRLRRCCAHAIGLRRAERAAVSCGGSSRSSSSRWPGWSRESCSGRASRWPVTRPRWRGSTCSHSAGSSRACARSGPAGGGFPLAVRGGRLTPRTLLTPGETVSVEAVVRRPGWLGWALGSTRNVQRTIRAPVATVERALAHGAFGLARERELRPSGERGRVRAPRAGATLDAARALADARAPSALAGTVAVAAAARPWERLGTSGRGQLVPARRACPSRVSQPGAGRAARSGSLRSGSPSPSRSPRRSARAARSSRRAPAAAGARPTATRSSSCPRASAPASPPTCESTCRAGGRHRACRAAACERPAGSRWTVPAGLDPAPAAAARAGRLPAARLDAGRRAGRAHAARPSCKPRSTRRRAASAGAIRTRRPSCRRCGARAARTRSRAAP